MEEEDDDVIFDRAGLLSSNTIKPPPDVRGNKLRIYCTVCLCAAFFGLGLCIAIPGPTLLDLQQSTNADTSEISRIFTGRSVGYLVGSIIGGFLFDYFNQSCLLSFSLLLSALGTAAAPWCTSYVFLMGILAFQGVSMGFLDTGGNVLCLNTWGRQSAPYMQTLHFSFGLGAFVAPLVAEPFLSNATFNETLIEMQHKEEERIAEGLKSMVNPHHRVLLSEDIANGGEETAGLKSLKSPQRTLLSVHEDIVNEGEEIVGLKSMKSPQRTLLSVSGDDIGDVGEESRIKRDETATERNNETPKNATKALKPKITDKSNIPPPPPAANPPPPPMKIDQEDKKDSPQEKTTTTTVKPTTTKATTKKPVVVEATTDNTAVETNDTTPVAPTKTISTIEKVKVIGNKILELPGQAKDVMKNLSKVQFAYLTIALFNFVVSFMFLVLCCCGGKSLKSIQNQDTQPEYIVRKENKGFRVQILIMLFVFYFLYVGMEVTYGAFLMAFCVDYLHWDKTKGVLMTSVFWGSFAMGRGLAIPLAKCLNPPIMLIADLILCCLSLIGLVMGLDSNDTILWFCTAVLGLGLSSVFPTGITWAERYMHVTGKATAVFVVGSALGEMAMPALVGWLFEAKNPMWLMKILLACALLSVVLYIFMQNLATNMGDRYQRLPRLVSLHDGIDMEMDSVPISNHTEVFNSDDTLWPPPHRSDSQKKVTFNLHNNGHVHTSTKKGSILKTRQSKQD